MVNPLSIDFKTEVNGLLLTKGMKWVWAKDRFMEGISHNLIEFNSLVKYLCCVATFQVFAQMLMHSSKCEFQYGALESLYIHSTIEK